MTLQPDIWRYIAYNVLLSDYYALFRVSKYVYIALKSMERYIHRGMYMRMHSAITHHLYFDDDEQTWKDLLLSCHVRTFMSNDQFVPPLYKRDVEDFLIYGQSYHERIIKELKGVVGNENALSCVLLGLSNMNSSVVLKLAQCCASLCNYLERIIDLRIFPEGMEYDPNLYRLMEYLPDHAKVDFITYQNGLKSIFVPIAPHKKYKRLYACMDVSVFLALRPPLYLK